ncbi:sensor histidine kinase [Methylobacterium sp. SyP6R]|uniref:sensor histidine kinase n=1 Tax=Methylobacterium sp. SyP6R TaxID=2718876 RepID=UPI001F015F79|nr:response regulator [Methylobacterium sp. SyP6R]MCF4128168.1 response regulator [Methylobacterium sp. SyP6R]
MTEPVRLLYIDDDPGLARLVTRTLAARGCAVVHAPDGETGLALVAAEPFDVVALDHHMPNETGLEILPRIRALPEAPPVIYVTGSEDSRVAVAALKAGAVDYVWKDLQGHFRDLLAEAVATAVLQDRTRREKERAEAEVREARDRAELLLREVNHRVANSLALVAALVRMQANAVTDAAARAALEETQTRITAIAGIHRRLYTSDDVRVVAVDAYLATLVEDLDGAMNATGQRHRILLDAAPVEVATDKAVSLGVIVTELVTNAYKYAYPEGVTGEIRITARRDGDHLRLTVADDGVGWQGAGTPRGTGLGSRIVRAMASNLRAQIDYAQAERGTAASIDIAL